MMHFNLMQYTNVQLLCDNARRPCHSVTESVEQLPALCPYKPTITAGSYKTRRRRRRSRSRTANIPPPAASTLPLPHPAISRWESSPSPRASTYRNRPEQLLSQMRPLLRHLESSTSCDSSSDDSHCYYEPNHAPIQSTADHSPRLPTRRLSLESSCESNNNSSLHQKDTIACQQATTAPLTKLPVESTGSDQTKPFSALAG